MRKSITHGHRCPSRSRSGSRAHQAWPRSLFCTNVDSEGIEVGGGMMAAVLTSTGWLALVWGGVRTSNAGAGDVPVAVYSADISAPVRRSTSRVRGVDSGWPACRTSRVSSRRNRAGLARRVVSASAPGMERRLFPWSVVAATGVSLSRELPSVALWLFTIVDTGRDGSPLNPCTGPRCSFAGTFSMAWMRSAALLEARESGV